MLKDRFDEKEDRKKVHLDYIDYSQYKYNNWLLGNNNIALNALYEKGCFMFLTRNVTIYCKFSKNEIPIELTFKKVEQRFLSEFKMIVKIINDLPKTIINKEDDSTSYIFTPELITIQYERFNPYILKEFYCIDGSYYKNTFKPTKYMKLHAESYREPRAILALINHLVRYDRYRFDYFINWVAYFFKNLKKSQVSIVLLGKQGAGKGILFNNIITPLFGEEYSTTINDASLNTNFKGGIIKNKLFFNFDESSDAKRSSTKNFLKAIVTNKSVSAEEKNKTMESEIELFAQSLFTSNDPNPIEIEESDRRYTVITTADNLTYSNFLGYKNYDNLAYAIEDELEDFAKHLKAYPIDIVLANEALFTPEKNAIISSCTDMFKDFINAIVNVDAKYFDEVYDENIFLYDELFKDFDRNRIKKQNIHKAFLILAKGERNKVSAKRLLKQMRLHQPDIFEDYNTKLSNGNIYYLLPY
ncbi:MAG: hypothetical protein COA66_13870 [Arcobacter sp.]|nr:MAG: hypothetical protein COA66_13870 [Arcobacter sp.]